MFGGAGGPGHHFAAGFVGLAEGAAEIELLTLPGAEATGAAFTELEGEVAHHFFDGVEFFSGEVGEVFAAEAFLGGIGTGNEEDGLFLSARVGRLIGFVSLFGQGRGGGERARWAALGKHSPQVDGDPFFHRLFPKHVKGLIEEGEVFPVVDEEGAGGVVEVGFVADFEVVEGVDEVNHPPGIYVEAEAAENAAEEKEVVEEVGVSVRVRS